MAAEREYGSELAEMAKKVRDTETEFCDICTRAGRRSAMCKSTGFRVGVNYSFLIILAFVISSCSASY